MADVVKFSFMVGNATATKVHVSFHAVVVMLVDKCSEMLWSMVPLEVIPASHDLFLDSSPRTLAFALAK